MRQPIPVRTRILVGCEGESEQSYARFLNDLARELKANIHIDPVIMKGGDPLSRLLALQRYLRADRRRHGLFAHKYALIDTDQDALDPKRAYDARHLAHELGVTVIWQKPVHEAFLVRHFDGYTTRKPQTAADSLALLHKIWAGYVKGQSAVSYGKRLGLDHVRRAASVEPDLHALVDTVGLLP